MHELFNWIKVVHVIVCFVMLFLFITKTHTYTKTLLTKKKIIDKDLSNINNNFIIKILKAVYWTKPNNQQDELVCFIVYKLCLNQ